MNPVNEAIISICTVFEYLSKEIYKLLRKAILSKTWYENEDFDDLAGIHVRAKLYNGTLIEGKLHKWSGNIQALDGIPVLVQKVSRIDKASRIESVDYIWSEDDYEQIGWGNVREGDEVVCNGIPMIIDSIGEDTAIVKMNDDLPDIEIPKKLVSEVIRLKQDIPIDPGIYKSDHCPYLILDANGQWIVVKDDYTVELYEHDELPVRYRDNIRK